MKGKQKKNKTSLRTVFVYAVLIFTAVYPFLAKLYIFEVTGIEQLFFPARTGYSADISLHCREIALICLSACVAAWSFGEQIFPDHPEPLDKALFKNARFPLFCLGAYALLTVLSTVFSEYTSVAVMGNIDEFEGMWAILGYAVIFMFGFLYASREQYLRVLRYSTVVMCAFLGLLAVIESVWKPIVEFRFVQFLISSPETRATAYTISNQNFIGQTALFFQNPGFLGGFCALYIPVVFCIGFSCSKLRRRLGCYATVVLLAIALRGSYSAAGQYSLFLSGAAALVCIVLISRSMGGFKAVLPRLGITLAAVGAASAAAVILVNIYGIPLSTASNASAEGVAERTEATEKNGIYRLSKATLENGILTFESGGDKLVIEVGSSLSDNGVPSDASDAPVNAPEDITGDILFSDGKNPLTGASARTMKATSISDERKGYCFDDPRYSMITFSQIDSLFYIDFGYTGIVQFFVTDEGFKSVGQNGVPLDYIQQPLITGLERFYSFGTGRGYIWAQSLPMLKDCLLLGKGPGCFTFYFPQNELVGLMNTHGSYRYVVNRAHNWYLSIAIASGIPALLFVLALFIWFIAAFIGKIYGFFRKYTSIGNRKTEGLFRDISVFEDASEALCLSGLFAGLIGFMLVGIINDSCVTVNPFFWLLLGTATGMMSRRHR